MKTGSALMKTAAALPNEAKSPRIPELARRASSLAERLHSFISPVRGDFISGAVMNIKEILTAPRHFLYHRFEVGGDDERGLGGGLDLVEGELGVVLGEEQALRGHFDNAHLGDDLGDALDSRVGQFALFEDLRVALSGVLHRNDDVLRADEQIHRAAHAGHLFAGDDPVGEGALFVDLEAAECIQFRTM